MGGIYSTIKNFISNNRYEIGYAIGEIYFTSQSNSIEFEHCERIQLGRLFKNNAIKVSDSTNVIPEKIKKIWEEVKLNPESTIKKSQWFRVLARGYKVLPLLGYTVMFSRVMGFSSLGRVTVCVLTPVFSRMAIALAEQAEIPTNLLEYLDKGILVYFEALNILCVVLKKTGSLPLDTKAWVHRFSIYFIDTSIHKIICLVKGNSLLVDSPFINACYKYFFLGDKHWKVYYSSENFLQLLLVYVSILFFGKPQESKSVKKCNEEIAASASALFIKENVDKRVEAAELPPVHPSVDHVVWLLKKVQLWEEAADDQKFQVAKEIFSESWKHLTIETEREFLIKMLGKQICDEMEEELKEISKPSTALYLFQKRGELKMNVEVDDLEFGRKCDQLTKENIDLNRAKEIFSESWKHLTIETEREFLIKMLGKQICDEMEEELKEISKPSTALYLFQKRGELKMNVEVDDLEFGRKCDQLTKKNIDLNRAKEIFSESWKHLTAETERVFLNKILGRIIWNHQIEQNTDPNEIMRSLEFRADLKLNPEFDDETFKKNCANFTAANIPLAKEILKNSWQKLTVKTEKELALKLLGLEQK